MANPRIEPQEATKQQKYAAQRVTEEVTRVGQSVAVLGDQAARTSAEMAQHSVEAWQAVVKCGSDLANELAQQSSTRFSRTLGISSEDGQRVTHQSARNLDAMARSTSLLTQNAQDVSREYLDLWRKMTARTMSGFENLARVQTPQELLAVQSEIIRDNMQEFLNTTRRTAETSMRMADEATRSLAEISDMQRRAA